MAPLTIRAPMSDVQECRTGTGGLFSLTKQAHTSHHQQYTMGGFSSQHYW